ncbi:MAG: hypothetical protein IT306_31040 [Chloroflexi bacterium]|nr:hypothetical protein [Chloroflexota bacterium]
MYRYRAYGFIIDAEMPLPELRSAVDGPADVAIRYGAVGRPPAPPDPQTSAYAVSPDDVRFFWELVGSFRVRAGREILVDPVPDVEQALLRIPLLGSVLGVLLHQRGSFVLHASAVDVDGRAAIFLGPKGQGKSTTAALLVGRGHPLVADDIVALDMGPLDKGALDMGAGALGAPAPTAGESIRLLPSFPQMKLFDDAAAAAFGDDPEDLPLLASLIPKRARRTPDRFADRPLAPGAIYVLADGPELSISRLTGQDAVCEVIGSSIPARFGSDLLDGPASLTHFQRAMTLLRQVPVYQLARPRDLAGLGRLGAAIEAMLRQPVGAGA